MCIPTVGFGGEDFDIAIYIANRPPIDNYPQLNHFYGLAKGELEHIVANCSNHWRKVFNVYAKFLLSLQTVALQTALEENETVVSSRNISRWQTYRDHQLLQTGSREALLFSPPDLTRANTVHIIAGKTYASELSIEVPLTWEDNYFAINRSCKLIVSPYLDYRQLSDLRIEQLANLVKSCL